MMDDALVVEDSRNVPAEERSGVVGDTSAGDNARVIAPWWHTAAVLAIFAAWGALGHGHHQNSLSADHVALYLSSVLISWMLVGTAVAGIFDRRRFFFDTLKRNAQPWLAELGIAAAIYFGILFVVAMVAAVLMALHHPMHPDQNAIRQMAPQNVREMVSWVLLSVSAGVCEELVFRGYLLQQGMALMRRMRCSPKIAGIVCALATAALFGSLHLYEGVSGAAFVTLLGFVYAIIVLWRGNLRAVMIAHAMQDLFAGLMLFALRHAKF